VPRALRWLVAVLLALGAVAFAREPDAHPSPSPSPTPSPSPSPSPTPSPSPNPTPSGDGAFFRSPADCERALRAHPRRAPGASPRIGTWNLRWFPRGTANGRDPERRTDVAWMACAIAGLDVDVLALQEVVQDAEGRNALLDLAQRLDTLTGGRWRAELDDCAGSGRQHVGFLFDTRRVELRGAGAVDALNPGRSGCDRSLRPGFAAHARFTNGADAHLIAVHLDSGVTQRDFDNRARSLSRLGSAVSALQAARADRDVIVLGDFNTMGCAQCAAPNSAADELTAFDAQLARAGFGRVPAEDGSAACSEYYRGHAGLLDHVALSRNAGAAWRRARVRGYGACAELACATIPRGATPAAFERLSDHCPRVMELK
jgi:predicted extracellular nuclease